MATQVEKAIKKAKSLIGSHNYDNYCQRFVRICYEAAGIYGSAESAVAACKKWKVSGSKSNIPVGAAVYYSNNNQYGHVGIYIGNNKIIHAWSGVQITSIDVPKGFLGWGWQGGKKPSGAGETVSDSSSAGDTSSEKSTSSSSVELCSTSIVSTVNTGSKVKERQYINIESNGSKYELHIINNGYDYVPIVVGSAEWTTEYVDTAGKLTFKVLKDSNIDITEGNVVIFKAEGQCVFYGYLFEKSKGKDGTISCTAYDQLRYLKNKDTYCYKEKKYSDVLKMIAREHGLICSPNVTDTEYVIPLRVEDNESLFDILKNARELTRASTGKTFILFDDFGSLNVKNIDDLVTDYLLTEKTAENFDYKTSIDDDVYNRIQIYKDNSETGNREKYIYEDGNSINAWGVLQKTVKLEDGESPEEVGPNNLKISNRKKRSFSVKGCFGDVRIRGGASIFVSLNVGDVVYDKAKFFITKASHKFGKEYTCDLDLEEADANLVERMFSE